MRLLFLLLALSVSPAAARAGKGTSCSELLNSYREIGFSGAVLVREGSRVVCREALGDGVHPEDHFLIGSVTKQFTAASVMLLVERGQLAVSDPLAKFFPGWPNGENISIEQLLTHTAGLADFVRAPGFDDLCKTPFHDLSPLVALIRSLQPDFAPGARWQYSNSNYAVLAAVVEKISGRDWGDFLSGDLLIPMGLHDTNFGTGRPAGPLEGHTFSRDYALVPIAPTAYLERGWASGAGSLESTVDDLATWNSALFGGKVLSAGAALEMAKPRVSAGSGQAYGYGLLRDLSVPGEDIVFHSGGIPGYQSLNIYFPKRDASVVVISDVEDSAVQELGWKLAELVRGLAPEAADGTDVLVPAEQLRDAEGSFNSADLGLAFQFRFDGEHLYETITGGPEHRVLARSPLRFYDRLTGDLLEFAPDYSAVTITHGKQTFRASRGNTGK